MPVGLWPLEPHCSLISAQQQLSLKCRQGSVSVPLGPGRSHAERVGAHWRKASCFHLVAEAVPKPVGAWEISS